MPPARLILVLRWLSTPRPARSAREKASVILGEAEALLNSRDEQGLFLYLVLDRAKANLALARHNLRRIESDLSV